MTLKDLHELDGELVSYEKIQQIKNHKKVSRWIVDGCYNKPYFSIHAILIDGDMVTIHFEF